MKKNIIYCFATIVLSCLAISAVSAQDLQALSRKSNPIITKSNSTGFTLIDFVRTETCNVYRNRVEIISTYGGEPGRSYKTKETIRFRASKGIYDVLAGAVQEELVSSMFSVCDGPSTIITANYLGVDYTLFSTAGCGSPRLERVGNLSRILVNTVDKYCPVTHDFIP